MTNTYCVYTVLRYSWWWTVVKVKQFHYMPGQTLRVPGGEAPRFQESRHMKVVRLSALGTGRLYPQEVFLVLISVRGWVGPRTIVRPYRLCQWKNPVTPWGTELAPLRFVGQCLNQLCYRVDGQWTGPKHVGYFIKINLRNSVSRLLL